MSSAHKVLMIEPVHFQYNPETAADNFFQKIPGVDEKPEQLAAKEYDELRIKLLASGIEVVSIKPDDSLLTPDEVFPNNWFSTHPDGKLIFYPMKALNRRLERRESVISLLKKKYTTIKDLRRSEDRGLYLEGTGSIVIDHDNKIAYASLSERTSTNLLQEWGKVTAHELVIFSSYDKDNKQIYHTNVMLCIGHSFAIICKEAISGNDEKRFVTKRLIETNHELIEISFAQMHNFCANCLELQNSSGEYILVMSQRAFDSFSKSQQIVLQKHSKILVAELNTIENYGGGGARCMLAELF